LYAYAYVKARVCAGLCYVCEQVLSWFLDHQKETGLPICRIKNKFAFASSDLVGNFSSIGFENKI
jgi:hypothetical protein